MDLDHYLSIEMPVNMWPFSGNPYFVNYNCCMKNTKLSHSVFILLFAHILNSKFCMCSWFYLNIMCVLYCIFCIYFSQFKVLAHRGSHWSVLQCVCQTVWDHSCRITVLAAQLEPPCLITADQLHNTFTSLLVLSVDLIMDMLSKIGVTVSYR